MWDWLGVLSEPRHLVVVVCWAAWHTTDMSVMQCKEITAGVWQVTRWDEIRILFCRFSRIDAGVPEVRVQISAQRQESAMQKRFARFTRQMANRQLVVPSNKELMQQVNIIRNFFGFMSLHLRMIVICFANCGWLHTARLIVTFVTILQFC